MCRHAMLVVLAFTAALAPGLGEPAARTRADEAKPMVREIFVPFQDLNVLLENQPRRVLLSREEYEDLLEKAKTTPDEDAPRAVVLASAGYTATVEEERAQLAGTLSIEVLEDGLHAVPLDLSGVGLREALLDGKPAAMGRAGDGRLTLFVEGKGRHELALAMVAPLETTAARQVLNFRLPRPPAARLDLTVPGDVEVKSGAAVAGRVVDEQAGVTRLELLLREGDTSLVMTLNSRLQRRQRAVVARSVIVDEVTEAYERLHATVSLGILHQAVDGFRFVVPDGFEVTEVSSPEVARWAMEAGGPRPVLDVRLREPTTETVVLNLSAVRTPPRLDDWTWPKLEPLDVVGQVAVVSLLVDRRLKAESIAAEGLIPIDTAVLRQAIPETVLRDEPGAPSLEPVVAYYAPQAEFDLAARFTKPPAAVAVTTNVLLLLEDRGQQVRGEFFLSPQIEKLFAFDFEAPADWHVTGVATADGSPLAFERYELAEGSRIHVSLPNGIPPGEQYRVDFRAESTPAGWLAEWDSQQVEFPAFTVAGAARDVGAIAVEARDDFAVRPEILDRLMPLDETEKEQYGLGGVATNLVYRYESRPYRAVLSVERSEPRITARTFSFLRIEPDVLHADYEIIYEVEEARTRELALLLPADTPANLDIRGLDDLKLKAPSKTVAGGIRRWNVLLEEPRRGTLRLALDFQQPLAEEELKDFPLPIVRADGVAYQSGLVAVEGNSELHVQVDTEARRVDVGELADAEHQPGRGLLGAFGFVGDPAPVKIDVFRHPGYKLHPTLVQRAELRTLLSTEGVSQTSARFDLITKAMYLEVKLPPGAKLWSADLDGTPIKPQREGTSVLVSLPAGAAGAVHALRIVYQSRVNPVGLAGDVELSAPKLLLHADREAPGVEVPMADLVWQLQLPTGYEVIRSGGTVVARLEPPEPAALQVAKGVLGLTFWSPMTLQVAREAAHPHGIHAWMPDTESGSQEMPSPYYLSDDAEYFDEYAGEATAEGEENPELDRLMGFAPSEDDPERVVLEDMGTADSRRHSLDVDINGAVGMEAPGVFSADLDVNGPVDGMPEPPSELATPDVPHLAPADPEPDVTGGGQEEGGQAADAFGLEPQAPPTTATESGDEYQMNQLWLYVGDGKPAPPRRGLKGFRSLMIDVEQADEVAAGTVTFESLGVDPKLVVTLADRSRLDALGWVLALAVALLGLVITNRPGVVKIRLILAVFLVGTLVPLVPSWESLAIPANMAVYAAALLVPYYFLAGLVKWIVGLFRRIWGTSNVSAAATAATAAVLLAACLIAPLAMAGGPPGAAGPENKDGPYVVQIVGPPEPVNVPADAVILPYDPESDTGIRDADQMLVPYTKYVELWNRAYPDKKLETEAPPAPYALAGASYTARLEGDEYLLVEGQLAIDVYVDEYAAIPLGLAGGVLARAVLDGKPARLSVPGLVPENAQGQQGGQQPAAQPMAQQAANPAAQQRPAPNLPMVVLHVSGKGRHQLEVSVRLRLERRGGWRVAEGVLPAAPAAALALTVPEAQTDVLLGQVLDRPKYETEQADEQIDTALGPGGAVSIQWRPKVAEGEVDRSLTARSTAVLDVQEDGLRVAWKLALEFRRSQRDVFTLQVPEEYLVEKVEGTNVRGWEVSEEAGLQTLTVTLLKTARDSESFTVRLWRAGAVGRDELAEFDVPVVTVADAALESGELTIRRSPMLELQCVSTAAVGRTDLSAPASNPTDGSGESDSEESPLGIRPFQAYAFVSTPFSIRLAAAPVVGKVTADVQTILKIAEFERTLESRVNLTVEARPIYQAEIVLPDDLELDDVSAPGDFQWALTRRDGRPMLTVYLATGQQGEVPLVITGRLGRQGAANQVPLPEFEVLGVGRQSGDVAVQVDPAFDVEARDLENCETVLLRQVFGWLNPGQQGVTRLALHYRRPGYRGTLHLSLREPIVTCDTISNVCVTDRAVEETIFLDFTIENAGIREVSFLLPARLKDCRIDVLTLRQKTIEPAGPEADAPLRVRLELQDEVMDQFRVLVQNDRLLTADAHTVPIPIVETGRTGRQFVTLESAGRDEVVVDAGQLAGLEQLSRQQKEWDKLKSILGAGITQAYLVTADAQDPRLVFQTKKRTAWETVGARIGLAQTNLVFDANGAYRAEQIYWLDNKTEQFLEIKLPGGARLWTARLWTTAEWTAWQAGGGRGNVAAGAPVKPTEVPGANDPQQVRIPLVKTAPGDLDYVVQLKYAGKLPSLGNLSEVEFPLIRKVNVNVELSQVRLHLPDTHRWLDFGGTMGPAEEADLAADYMSYQTKVANRLKQTIQHGGSFARVRAAYNLSNLKQLQVILDDSESMRGVDYDSERYQQEYTKNAEAFQEAEQQVEQLEQAPEQLDEYGNRDRLNALFDDQTTNRSRNVVQELGPNWKADATQPAQPAQPPPQEGSGQAGFNYRWLNKSGLENPVDTGKPGESKRFPPAAKGESRFSTDKKGPSPVQSQFHGKGGGQGGGQRQPEGPQPGDGSQSRPARGSGWQKDAVDRYQEQQKQQAGIQLDIARANAQPEAVALSTNGRMTVSGRVGQTVATAGDAWSDRGDLLASVGAGQTHDEAGFGLDPAAAQTLAAGMPAGMASLDVQLPQRGTVYRFVTPGGDVELTARAVPDTLITGLTRAGITVVLVLVILLVVRLARRGRLDWLAGRTGSTCLIVVGLILLLPFPLLGLVMLVAGIAIKIRRQK